ncbi:MAG: serine--tRNA ligase [PS1 clade bacterium]|uniref:Serine--tRNA ligase n=1 Tax=PS1 clade bacterium TaxID=2175152 RepID=A0A368E1Z1_9PROT|nr:MAG: serine--tRNA ligase [PS1 clade bacterium]HAK97904.1 serine--tRNA ligase [Rhodobiaceae bacterium]HCV49061.1 serine--tRNA ligase [Rhodobiaceae bacterium]|tara:strand:+ start:32386 stop:33666 length:1281 start_codon:yes stop_codon:yes gene_type:complete
MLDISIIRDNPEKFDDALASRGAEAMSKQLLTLDEARRMAVSQAQELQTKRNETSKQIGRAKAAKDEDLATKLMDEVAKMKDQLQTAEESEREASLALENALAAVPNIPLEDIPVGTDENFNVEIRKVGAPTRIENPKQHFDIGEELGQMDFESAAKMSGSRFVVLQGQLARLERALASFMLDTHTEEFGYTEVVPPALVRDDAVFGTGQLPKFKEDLFRTEEGFWLIPTAEVPLSNLVREQILDAEDLPLRFTAYTPCFRSEAGSAGRDTRGMIRQHQFSKVELVSIVMPEDGADELERMTNCAETILQKLDLPYRVMMLCTGDMGFSARKTYDLEVWLPGQDNYREISSCSLCGDFQSRRMKTRFRHKGDKQTHFAYTLNGSGLAVGRTMVALLENYQDSDGRVYIPSALQPYMGGKTHIEVSA